MSRRPDGDDAAPGPPPPGSEPPGSERPGSERPDSAPPGCAPDAPDRSAGPSAAPPSSPDRPEAPLDPADLATRRATPGGVVRWAFLAFGFICVGIGLVGVVLPGLPTTVFMLLALWAFARSSRRFHDWLYHHPRFGPPLREWTLHGVVPRRAKLAAIATMAASAAIIGVVLRNLTLWMAVTGVMTAVALWLASRPERPYADAADPTSGSADGGRAGERKSSAAEGVEQDR